MSYGKRPSLTFPQNAAGHVLEAHDTGENSRATSILDVSREIVGGHVLEAHDTGEIPVPRPSWTWAEKLLGVMCWKHMIRELGPCAGSTCQGK